MRRMVLTFLWAVIAALFLLYGILILSVHSGTRFYLIWFLLGGFCVLFAIAAYFHWWSHLPGLLRKILIVLIILGIALFLIVEGCVVSGFSKKGREQLDYVIVLGAQIYEYGPSVVLRYRLDKTIEYLQENPETICIVSGGQGKMNHSRKQREWQTTSCRKGSIRTAFGKKSHRRIRSRTSALVWL